MGASGARALGLPATRAKDLELRAAWLNVAGPAVARRASVVSLKRGVLELRLDDESWRRPLEDLLPELGARFSRHHANLGVTRFHLVRQ